MISSSIDPHISVIFLLLTVLTTILLIYRLGHREQKDEWVPRLVEVFQRHNVLPPNAVVSAGATNSACTGGMLFVPFHDLIVNIFSLLAIIELPFCWTRGNY